MKRIEDFNNNLKEVFHYPKENENRYERRTTSVMDIYGNLWGCISFEDSGKRLILIQAQDNHGKLIYKKKIRECNIPSRPFLYARDDGGISLVWVELKDNKWNLIYAEKKYGEQDFVITIVHSSQYACLQPAMCLNNGNPFVVWSEYNKISNKFNISFSKYKSKEWSNPLVFSEGEGHCYRPVICSNQKSIFIAWDEGFDGKQFIVVREISLWDRSEHNYIIKREQERLINPSLAIDESSVCSIACISIEDVMDGNLGISDHKTGIIFAQIFDGDLIVNQSLVADLNEGLLGKNVYVPYFGIRRRCSLTEDKSGNTWLTWEMRFEEDRKDVISKDENKFSHEHYGYLIGKKLDKDGVWQDPVVLHQGGTYYSVSGINDDQGIGIVYLQQSNVFELPVLMLKWIHKEKQIELRVNKIGYERWDTPQQKIVKTKRYKTTMCEEELSLYWCDTHVHSNLSPDAEGEPDELILYGRDIAGLDAMAMVDNDYYPHSGLMEIEWENQQALAQAYTQSGEFVVFPGYEFTYHDKKMIPNFNHRYVIFPRKGKYFGRLDPESRCLESLEEKLNSSDAIMVAHHPNWKLSCSHLDQYVEICSSWRISIEEKDFIKDHLLNGEQFAFIGSSDTHRACPGLGGVLTGIYAKELEPEKLFSAYKKRRTIVTQGLRIVIDFHVNDLFIGDSTGINKQPNLRVKVVSPVDIEFVEIYRDGVVIQRYEDCKNMCLKEFRDDQLQVGRHFYYVRVKAIGDPSFNEPDSNRKRYSGPFIRHGRYPFNFARAQGPFAWCTPIWVEVH